MFFFFIQNDKSHFNFKKNQNTQNSMKKIFVLLTSAFLLASCVETIALLGPASSLAGGGNIAQSTVSSAINYGVKKKTGKSPMAHALAYAEEKNPNKEKKRCISFIEKTNSEACAIVKKQVSLTQTNLKKKSKSILKNIPLLKKDINEKKVAETIINPRRQAFTKARKKREDSSIFKGRIYNTRFKNAIVEKIAKPKDLIFVKNVNKNKNLIKSKKSVMEMAFELQAEINKKSKVKYLD